MDGNRTTAKNHRPRALCLLAALALMAGAPALAGGQWSVSLEPLYVSVHGHDQHVLTVREADLGAAPSTASRTAVLLKTNGNLAPRLVVRREGASWTFGVDVFWFITKHALSGRTASATGSGDRVTFEVADLGFVSTAPSEVLSFQILEDTELAAWTVDFYALRTLAETPTSSLALQLGMRNADFDNDYRAVVGVVGDGGRRIDASSNYGRMIGPLVGLLGTIERRRSRFEAYFGQSLVFGEAELTNRARDFRGALESAVPVEGEIASAFTDIGFRALDDVAIPISELRLGWRYRLGKRFELGVGMSVAAWWDVPVPPGVIPSAPGGSSQLLESTIVYSGLSAAVEIAF